MSAVPIEHADETRVALREIVAEHGVGALSQPVLFTSLLSDLLPGAPGISRILTAAAQDRIADVLREHVAQGMDAATAVRLTSHSFASATMATPQVCDWVVTEFAIALGLLPGAGGPAAGADGKDLGGDRTIVPGDPGARHVPDPTDLAGAPPTRRRKPEAERDPAKLGGAGADPPTLVADDTTPTPERTPQSTTTVAEKSRRKVIGVAAGGLAAFMVVVLIAAPWRQAPVAQPTGLTVTGTNATSVHLGWDGPSTGLSPGRYLVVVDGKVDGHIAGVDRSCTVRDLAPDTLYTFKLIAVQDGRRSAPSAEVDVQTIRPPLSAAVLNGVFAAHERVVKSDPAEPQVFSVGATRTDSWDFTPSCASGPCSSVLGGAINGVPIVVTLHRSGATYTGTVSTDKLENCGTSSRYPIHSTVHLRLTVTAAGAVGSEWESSAWSGSMTVDNAQTPAGAVQCSADAWIASVHS